jgi:two-component system nitrate/nitrite sensor histidine kinase NarX
LGTKLALVATPFLLAAAALIGMTLWVSWQLDGGAAALNEAGRMRMQGYRLSLSISTDDQQAVSHEKREFDNSIALLRTGDPERPLFVPWDTATKHQFDRVQSAWIAFRERWTGTGAPDKSFLRNETAVFAAQIDALVSNIESHLSRWTAILHLLQATMLLLAIIGTAVLLYTGHLFVLEPVSLLKRATERLEAGDLSARVDPVTTDEFGSLAKAFNAMADHLQSMYRNLESRVAAKTVELEEKRERLETLYSVTTLISNATDLEELGQGFTERIRRVAHADGVALRWANESRERFILLASQGLPAGIANAENCLRADECHCGTTTAPQSARVIPISDVTSPSHALRCQEAGYQTIVSLPVRTKERLMGEVDLFYHARHEPSVADRSLLEALTAHLAGGMENLRLNALAKEAAVSQERTLLARELHDSIAQSLAFLKIQVQLMRDALEKTDSHRMRDVLAEIDLGVQESYADVRELLMNFRTRANEENIETALATTLRKFEHHSGLKASLRMHGHGIPLAPQIQVQVLHVVQEALSNVRKHSKASQVWLDVHQQPHWRFELRDNGQGFERDASMDETHVGLRIMAERAAQIDAALEVVSSPGQGTSVVLTLPARAPASTPARGWDNVSAEAVEG